MTGRPSKFSQVLADKMCARLADGESLRGICRDDDMPAASTVFGWLAGSDEKLKPFMEQYARAREVQADALVDEILEIADDATNDWMERRSEAEKGEGVETGWVVNGEHVQRSRLRIDSRKWFASKVYPKKYGEKVQQEIDLKHDVTVTFQSAAISAVAEIIGEATAVRTSLPSPDSLPN